MHMRGSATAQAHSCSRGSTSDYGGHCLQVQASTALAGVDNTAKSLLLFDSTAEVQGLFDFLLNEATRICGSDCDVPKLLAPVAFPGACLKQHSVRVRAMLLWAVRLAVHGHQQHMHLSTD